MQSFKRRALRALRREDANKENLLDPSLARPDAAGTVSFVHLISVYMPLNILM